MHNKKTLLKRLLVIYVSFFIILTTSIVHSVLPQFLKGYNEGSEMSDNIVENLSRKSPKLVYMLPDVSVSSSQESSLPAIDGQTSIKAEIKSISLLVEEDLADRSIHQMWLSSVGGRPVIFCISILTSSLYIAMIVFMIIIINSLRRSIKNGVGLSRRNAWYMRIIGVLAITSVLCHDLTLYIINSKAAELLVSTDFVVDANFLPSYSTIILGVIIIFTAEVFAIGYNLSEEQKYTI